MRNRFETTPTSEAEKTKGKEKETLAFGVVAHDDFDASHRLSKTSSPIRR